MSTQGALSMQAAACQVCGSLEASNTGGSNARCVSSMRTSAYAAAAHGNVCCIKSQQQHAAMQTTYLLPKFSAKLIMCMHAHIQLLIWPFKAPSSDVSRHIKHTDTQPVSSLQPAAYGCNITSQPCRAAAWACTPELLDLLLHTSVAVTHKVRLTAVQLAYLQTHSCSIQAWWLSIAKLHS